MGLNQVLAGISVPDDCNVIIEIPCNDMPVKYEVDKDSSTLFVDRFMATPMFYPANYGYIPQTLADDGDAVDVLVVSPHPIVHGAVVRIRPVGVLNMIDENGQDSKILAVPHSSLTSLYNNIEDYKDLPKLLIKQIQHFFENYKDLESGKWVKVDSWSGVDEAKRQILESVKAYK